jgi:hypothetical protein
MTEIERKALELVNEVMAERNGIVPNYFDVMSALCRAIEQHEAFRQEVSDAAEHLCKFYGVPIVMQQLERFIITKPDPLVEALKEANNMICSQDGPSYFAAVRTALAKRGLEIREKSE